VKAPVLLDVGGTKEKDASPKFFAGTTKLVKAVVIRLTARVDVIVLDV
jgi:hypothetical protein